MSGTISGALTGGCQCGACRFAAPLPLGRASICHCRMCQKAFGGFFGPLVSVPALTWTRGGPSYFQSSNLARRGFCCACGTPLTFEPECGLAEVAIGAFDDPSAIPPVIQHAVDSRLPWLRQIADLPTRTPGEAAAAAPYYAAIRTYQHPDHATARLPESERR